MLLFSSILLPSFIEGFGHVTCHHMTKQKKVLVHSQPSPKGMSTCAGLNADDAHQAANEEVFRLGDDPKDNHDDLLNSLIVNDMPAVVVGNNRKIFNDWDIISLEESRSPEESSASSASSATSEPISESSRIAELSPKSAHLPQESCAVGADTVSRLNMIDGLQLVCGSNLWHYPDPRLNLLSNQTLSTRDQHVSSLVVQLSSPTFSFQLLSSCLGWPVRIIPRDANPTTILHASPKAVLAAGSRDHCLAVPVNGTEKFSVGYACGYGHNFHVVEEVGDVITIYCARTLKYQNAEEHLRQGRTNAMQEASSAPLGTSRELLADTLLNEIEYQVWYDLSRKGISKKMFFAFEVFEEEEEAYVGGDLIDIRNQFI